MGLIDGRQDVSSLGPLKSQTRNLRLKSSFFAADSFDQSQPDVPLTNLSPIPLRHVTCDCLPSHLRCGTLKENSRQSSPIMASIVRPSPLLQSCIAPAARQALRRQGPQPHALSTALSTLNTSSFRTHSIAGRTSPLGSSAPKGVTASMLKVAGFHASGRRPILPAGPRECN